MRRRDLSRCNYVTEIIGKEHLLYDAFLNHEGTRLIRMSDLETKY